MGIPSGPYKFKCMYQHCRTVSLDNFAVCRLHRNFEITMVALAGFGATGFLAWFLYKFH